LRAGFRVLNALAPPLAGRWAYRLWFRSRRFPEPQRERLWRVQSEPIHLPHKYGPLALYRWGDGPLIVLLHGWNGRGLQLGAFAEPLVAAGFGVVAFDAPAHGRTPGKATTLFQIVDALQTVAQAHGPVKGIVAHSFGSMVCARALRDGLPVERVVNISPPTGLEFLVDHFCTTLDIPETSRRAFTSLLEQHYGGDIWEQTSVLANARKLQVPCLVIHDRDDPDVPWQQGKQVAHTWPGARFQLTEGLGHRRILRHPEVVTATVDFLRAMPSD
jgi:pimeloyl-ACP methyl ester carboxylesterase